jgi:O-antigen ligase
MEPEQYTLLEGRGRANVHNDGLQFLAEFGVVGAGMLLAAGAFCLRPFFRRRFPGGPVPFFVMFGLAAVVAHSLLDLPFRSPAVMFLWCAMLAAVGVWEVDAVQRQVAALKGNLASRGERSMFKNNVFFA